MLKKCLAVSSAMLFSLAFNAPSPTFADEQTVPAVADLTKDWSDYENPFGPWTLRQGPQPLPSVANAPPLNLPYPQQVWAPSGSWGNFLPAWFKAAGAGVENMQEDWKRGDIIVHTTDAGNGAGSGPANVLWTSPSDGVVTVSGGVWNARNNGRANKWKLAVDGQDITWAAISSNDGHDRDHPYLFSAGSGGIEAVSRIRVHKRSTIALYIVSTVQYGEFTGVRLIITPVNR